jgi:hypothetical protein
LRPLEGPLRLMARYSLWVYAIHLAAFQLITWKSY